MGIESSIAGFTRNSLFDPLRVSRFWLYDVAPIDNISLPIFTPLSGFTSVSSPEVTVETQTITEGNWPFPKKVVKSADVSNITLSRGVTFYDSDFWRWINAAIHGNTGSISPNQIGIGGVTYRRSLMLIHFFRNVPAALGTDQYGNVDTTSTATVASVAALATVGGAAISVGAGLLSDSVTTGVISGAQLASMEVWGGLQPHSMGIKVPARAFLLKNCIPIRYKTGGDFDANSGEISIQELEVAVELIEEIALAAS